MEHRIHGGMDEGYQHTGAEPHQYSLGWLRKVRPPYPFDFRRPYRDDQHKERQADYSQFHGQLEVFIVRRLGAFPIVDNGVFYGETILKRGILIHAEPNPHRMVLNPFCRVIPNLYSRVGVRVLRAYVHQSLFQRVGEQDRAENNHQK